VVKYRAVNYALVYDRTLDKKPRRDAACYVLKGRDEKRGGKRKRS